MVIMVPFYCREKERKKITHTQKKAGSKIKLTPSHKCN